MKYSFGRSCDAGPRRLCNRAVGHENDVVYAIENVAKIEVAAFVLKIKMALHRQHWPGRFSFCLFLRHRIASSGETGDKFRLRADG
jgi:hypothetical protein